MSQPWRAVAIGSKPLATPALPKSRKENAAGCRRGAVGLLSCPKAPDVPLTKQPAFSVEQMCKMCRCMHAGSSALA